MGRRGLYGAIGGDKDAAAANMAMLWILKSVRWTPFAA
ncbi:winged helix-turn-helix domain-containing protein [Bradyrhizobium sp. 13971]